MSRKIMKPKLEKAEDEEESITDWEQEIITDQIQEEMESMWEIPQIYHFLHVTKKIFHISSLSIYEVERMVLIPRASKQLANIMTHLLSTPLIKTKLQKIPPMPYEFWTNILAHKVKSWFKVYHGKQKDTVKILETIGVEPEFWNIFPDASLFDDNDFEDLSFKQRIWLLKTICDTVMHSRKSIQEEIMKQTCENQFEIVLGMDRYGAKYIYFPQYIETELRIYKHNMDNKILSTAKPTKPNIKMQETMKILDCTTATKKIKKKRKKKLRWCNGLSAKTRKRENKYLRKQPNRRSGIDNVPSSLINKDINTNNDNTYNNNNTENSVTREEKQIRSLSKYFEENESKATQSDSKSTSSNINLSSSDQIFTDELYKNVFKGFSNNSDEKNDIVMISSILSDLKSEMDIESKTSLKSEIEDKNIVDETIKEENTVLMHVNTVKQPSTNTDLNIIKEESTDKFLGNPSSSSKTDDEKINEIIEAESTKLKVVTSTTNISNVDSPSSKSDDEKLSETKITDSNLDDSEVTTNLTTNQKDSEGEQNINYSEIEDETSYTKCNSSISQIKSGTTVVDTAQVTRQAKLRAQYKLLRNRNKIPNEIIKCHIESDNNVSINKIRSRTEINCSNVINDIFDQTTYKCLVEIASFNKMLRELSVSNFKLVVNSVDGLRSLISSFSTKNISKSNNMLESSPLCEKKLVNKLMELLNTVENLETTMKVTTKKVKSKLQKEWLNFKKGQAAVCCSSVEDQDSSGEGGLNSNWWVLGSQGCPLSSFDDEMLQSLPQFTLSSFQTQFNVLQSENYSKKDEKEITEENSNQYDKKKIVEDQQANTSTEEQGKRGAKMQNDQQCLENGETEDAENNEKEEDSEQTRRVLRTRGVSSYTEQFYSDEDIVENEFEEWAKFEAVYANPSTQTDASIINPSLKIGHNDVSPEREDSDQDWILPGSRKRKNKRMSASRKLKSLHQKMQNIKADAIQNVSMLNTYNPNTVKSSKDKHKNRQTKESQSKRSGSPQINFSKVSDPLASCSSNETVPSRETICKIGNVSSVHSELDIKDEGPIFDSISNQQYENISSMNHQQSYSMDKTNQSTVANMNYAMSQNSPLLSVQHNPLIQQPTILSSVMSPIQHGYYVQDPQRYVLHNSQSNYIPPPQAPLPHQMPQMMPQHFVNHPAYLPYVMNTVQSSAMHMSSRNQTGSQEKRQYSSTVSQCTSSARQSSHTTLPKQNFNRPRGRKNTTFTRINCSKSPNVRVTKKNGPQQRTSNFISQKTKKSNMFTDNSKQKTTSLIVLSDSDDDIEMIITEKESISNWAKKVTLTSQKNTMSQSQKPTVTADVTLNNTKGVIPPQIIQRMNQGGISITPVKPPPIQNTQSTQLVVVVNETGSHYALALPNGSKLILTPEQVAQIRASNGGKLIL